nr:pentapeptide repeat-containing protein [uncultured Draconibacterium sp.]
MAYSTITTQAEFQKKVSRIQHSSLANYEFNDKIFAKKLVFVLPPNNFSFKNCIFKEDFEFPNILNKPVLIQDCVFEKKVSFTEVTFAQNVRFYSTKFKGDISFYNTRFHGLADFWNAKFYKKIVFNKTDFMGTTVFSDATFYDNVLFTYTLINQLAIFRGTKFKKGLDFSLAIVSGSLNIFDIEITNFPAISDINDTVEFSNIVSEKGEITRKNKRETFRIIKDRLLINHNAIDAQRFANLEVKAYKEELSKGQIRNGFLIKAARKLVELCEKLNPITVTRQDKLLIWFNGISNKHNTSWIRGAIFTLSVALLFSYLSVVNTESYRIGFESMLAIDFTRCIRYFTTSLLPTHSIDYLDSENPTWGFYIFDFLGRIFISYGIYQTVQAFRKFKSK